jgi:hypothetical protein
VFGLMLATVLTLILTPVMLAAPTVWRESRAARRERRAARKAAKAAPPTEVIPDQKPPESEMREAAE